MKIEPAAPAGGRPSRVYTITNFHDVPVQGVADYMGRPHAYERQFSYDDDEWTDLYWLREIGRDLLELAIEWDSIFWRWQKKWRLGQVSLDSYPVLPEDKPRYEELRHAIGDRLEPLPEESLTRRGRFHDGGVEWTMP